MQFTARVTGMRIRPLPKEEGKVETLITIVSTDPDLDWIELASLSRHQLLFEVRVAQLELPRPPQEEVRGTGGKP